MTIDNPSDMKELTEKSGESTKDDTNKLSVQERSRTLGDIEGSASTPLKVRNNCLPINCSLYHHLYISGPSCFTHLRHI